MTSDHGCERQGKMPLAAYVITGPTSGIGRASAFELAKHGPLILVGRDPSKLSDVRHEIERGGQRAVIVVADLSDMASVRKAATEIVASGLPIAGVLNNAGVLQTKPTTTAQGWDATFATNHLGPFALTEALAAHLPDRAQILFLSSAVEDPERRPAKAMGIKGGRFLSVEASARGEWAAGGSKISGMDAYATSKQCVLAAAFALARELPRLRINSVEPGINPSTGLGGANALIRFLFGQIVTRFPPFSRYRRTPVQAAKVIAGILTEDATGTATYFDERGKPMQGSALVRDRQFQDRVVAQTRAFLRAVSS